MEQARVGQVPLRGIRNTDYADAYYIMVSTPLPVIDFPSSENRLYQIISLPCDGDTQPSINTRVILQDPKLTALLQITWRSPVVPGAV